MAYCTQYIGGVSCSGTAWHVLVFGVRVLWYGREACWCSRVFALPSTVSSSLARGELVVLEVVVQRNTWIETMLAREKEPKARA